MYDLDDEAVGPDPVMVEQLVEAMGHALIEAVIADVTTQADLLSALFTMLKRALKEAENCADPASKKRNAQEIGRVLADLLLEFGAESLQ